MADLFTEFGIDAGAPPPKKSKGKKGDLFSEFGINLPEAAAAAPASQRVAPPSDALPFATPENPGRTSMAANVPQPSPGFIDKALAAAGADRMGLNRATLGVPQAVARGGIKTLGGLGQVASAAVGGLGFPMPSQEAITSGTKSLLQQVPPVGTGPAERGAELASSVLPAALLPAASGGILANMGREAALGGGIAGASFVDDPSQAGLSFERLKRATLGAGLGAGSAAIGGGIGKGIETIAPGQGPARAIAGSGPDAVEEAARIGREQGIVVAPGAAGEGSERALADLGAVRFGDEADRDVIETALRKSTENAQKVVPKLASTILPEGKPSVVAKQRTKLFGQATDEKLSPQSIKDVSDILNRDVVGEALTINPVSRAAFEGFQPDQLGRADIVLKSLEDLAERVKNGRADAPKAGLPALWDAISDMKGVLKTSSNDYAKALDLSNREQVVRFMGNKFGLEGRREGLDQIDSLPVDDFYKTLFKNTKSFNSLNTELDRIGDAQVRSAAKAKAKEVRDLLSKFTRSKDALTKVVKGETPDPSQRGEVMTGIRIGLQQLLRGGQNRAMMDYILDGQTRPGAVTEALSIRNPTESALAVSRLLSRYGAANVQPAADTANQAAALIGGDPSAQ